MTTLHVIRLASIATLCAGLLACATPEAPGVRGRWKPVNRFADAPQPIPLATAYVFHASPVDGTLKNMLARWAQDARMSLAYEHAYDYTLHQAAAQVRTTDVHAAASQLSAAYAAQGIAVEVQGNRILVRASGGSSPAAGAGSDAAEQ